MKWTMEAQNFKMWSLERGSGAGMRRRDGRGRSRRSWESLAHSKGLRRARDVILQWREVVRNMGMGMSSNFNCFACLQCKPC